MAKLFRLWEKKRGERRTGSKVFGSVGEALFFAGLFLIGSVAMAAIITSQFLHAVPGLPVLTGWLLWLALVALGSMVLIGGAGVVLTVWQVGASTERRSALARRAGRMDLLQNEEEVVDTYPAIPGDEDITNSPGIRLAYRLPIAETPAWQLLAAAGFCLIWNGISSVLVVVAFDNVFSGAPDWWLLSFTVPFVAIGFGAIWYFVHQLRVHTGIGPTSVEVSAHPLEPGERYGVYVSQAGRLSVKSLEVLLVCEEEATYHQGTDVRTECRRVFEQQVLREEGFEINVGRPFEHQGDVFVPPGVMHSFQGMSNAVQWKLVVRGRAKGWPEYERSFPVIMHPGGNGKGSA